MVYKEKDATLLWIFVPIYLGFLSESFYFIIDDDELMIENLGLPFITLHYPFETITKIRITDLGGRTFSRYGLIVMREKKKSFRFRSAALKNKDWILMIKELKKNLEVDSEGGGYELKRDLLKSEKEERANEIKVPNQINKEIK